MRPHHRVLLVLIAGAAIAGCAAPPEHSRLRALAHLGPGPTYDVGPIQVTLVPPETVGYECGAPCGGGCQKRNFFGMDSPEYARGLRHKLIAVEDVYVVLHEFKHALEPRWTHPGDLRIGCGEGG
jgi:hypothetical protein